LPLAIAGAVLALAALPVWPAEVLAAVAAALAAALVNRYLGWRRDLRVRHLRGSVIRRSTAAYP
jgi:hypothetical protein